MDNRESKQRKKRLKRYRSPTLVLYGSLHKLTKGGSGLDTEGMMASPDKRP